MAIDLQDIDVIARIEGCDPVALETKE